MKKSIILIIVSFLTINLTAQNNISDALTIDGLNSLSDLPKEEANTWLTKENDFTFFQINEKYDASIYTYDFNAELNTAPMWLYYFNKTKEIFVIAKKRDLDKLIQQMESKKFLSNLNSDGTLISTYLVESKEFVLTIKPSDEVTLRVLHSPKDESIDAKKSRHSKIVHID
ncbi:hypothetical protein LRR18_14865 [Mangrovimonas sp. AS39]|uniref:hypothetical protein n=1 Tax=Mangrovimonas futianensis TaxID=2895523 RepID=UPI001E47DFD2|nr:hypothetical protein [Mangrovimonas futianensis]MCF1192874.1 hypothetical protein [Mangrovimonas futianensis]MCF1196524.1 hypothetical protein [Mangrovimonas futianensis]